MKNIHKKMYTVSRYTVAAHTWDTVALPRCAAFEALVNKGLAPETSLIVVQAAINENSEEAYASKENLREILEEGLCCPSVPNARFWAYAAGSSMIRKSSFVAATKEAAETLWDVAFTGFSPEGFMAATNKVSAYAGLSFSTSKPLQEVYGFDFDVRKVVIMKAGTTYYKVKADVVSADGSRVDLNVDRELSIAHDDGMLVYRAELFPGKVAPSFSLRASTGAVKGLAVPVADLGGWAADRNVSQITDIWGNVYDVQDVDVIMSETCFKQIGWTNEWLTFCAAFEQRGGHFRVCVEEHKPKHSRMCYQFLQTLVGSTGTDIEFLAGRAKTALQKYESADKACGLLGSTAAQVASAYPALLTTRWAARTIQDSYTAKRNRALGGSVPDTGCYSFVADDPNAFLENAFGLPVKGILKAGEVCCFAGGAGHKIDLCRNPQLDHSHVIKQNIHITSRHIVHNSTIYVNCWDESTVRLRMDYDGDHLWWTQNKSIIELGERTNQLIQMRVTDWDAPKGKKELFKMEDLNDFFYHNTQGSQIGIYADNATRVWARVFELGKRFGLNGFRTIVAWLTWAGNVLIDAAKHGSVEVVPPAIVENALYDCFEIQKTRDGILEHFWIFSDRYAADEQLATLKAQKERGVKYRMNKYAALLPAFCEFAKANESRPVGDKEWVAKVTHTNGVGDRYMRAVAESTDAVLSVKGIENMKSDYHDFMFDLHRPKCVKKLVGAGTWDDALKTYVKQGFWEELVGRRSADLDELELDPVRKAQWYAERDVAIREEIREYAEAQGQTLEAAYDIIVRQVFVSHYENSRGEVRTGWESSCWRTFFGVFGDLALKALEKNGFTQKLFYSEEDLVIDELDELDLDYLD